MRALNALPLLALVLLTQVSCWSESEPTFRFVTRDNIPSGKAVVYVYRPPSMIGSFGICNLKINEAPTGGLAAGQYTYVFVDPGKTRFETTGSFQAFVTVNVEESHEYFIKQTWILDLAGYHPRVENIPKLRAERELAECAHVENPPIIEEEVNEPEP